MSSVPSIGTGSPICSEGAWTSRNRKSTQRTNARDCGVGGRAPPHPTPIGAHFTLPVARLGNFGLPMVTVSIPLPLDSPRGQMTGWRGASWRFPRAWGEGRRCQPPGPSPILFASKFLSNTFWGFPQPPTPDLSWQVWVPLFLPWEGLEQDRKLGVFRALCTGAWAPSGHGTFLGPGNGASSVPQTCTASSPPPPRLCSLPSLPFWNGDWGRRCHSHRGLRGGPLLGSSRTWDGSRPWGLSPALAES